MSKEKLVSYRAFQIKHEKKTKEKEKEAGEPLIDFVIKYRKSYQVAIE